MNTTENNPKEIWSKFLLWVNELSDNNVFRGVSDKVNHLLIPSIGRTCLSNYTLKKEIQIFEQFKLKANIYTKAETDFEWLALAQHHGLPTRLLDWTFNPLVAAFFAVRNNDNLNARVYTVETNDFSFLDINKENNPFSISRISFIYPPIATSRLELQNGIFTIHPLPQKPILITPNGLIEIEYAHQKLEDYSKILYNQDESNEFTIQEVYYNENPKINYFFDIPSNCKSYFEKNIRKLGIDEMIFGNIDSISQQLSYQFSNNQIKNNFNPDFSVSFPILNKRFIPVFTEYIEKNPQSLSFLSHSFCIANDFVLSMQEVVTDNHYNSKVVKGKIFFEMFLNFRDTNSVFESKHHNHDIIKTISDLLEKIYGIDIMYAIGIIDFKAIVMFRGEYENINLYKDINFSWDSNMADFFSSVIPSYNSSYLKYKELTNHISIEAIEKLDIESEHYRELVEELKLKIFSE